MIIFQSTAFADPPGYRQPLPTPTVSPPPFLEPTETPADKPTNTPSPTPQPTLSNGVLANGMLKEECEGDAVITLQSRLRDLGYYTYKITGYFGAFTRDAVMHFQRVNDLMVDGTVGPETLEFLYSNKAIRRPIEEERMAAETARLKAEQEARAKAEAAARAKANKLPQKGELWDWFTKVNKAFPRGTKVQVMDLRTGATFYVIRIGGTNHADVIPATKADTAKFKKTFGGQWSWARRAVLVRLGKTWVAASINGYPHGNTPTRSNDMNGHVCVHFLNSKTHIRNAKDRDHQAMVMRAAGK